MCKSLIKYSASVSVSSEMQILLVLYWYWCIPREERNRATVYMSSPLDHLGVHQVAVHQHDLLGDGDVDTQQSQGEEAERDPAGSARRIQRERHHVRRVWRFFGSSGCCVRGTSGGTSVSLIRVRRGFVWCGGAATLWVLPVRFHFLLTLISFLVGTAISSLVLFSLAWFFSSFVFGCNQLLPTFGPGVGFLVEDGDGPVALRPALNQTLQEVEAVVEE